MFHRTNIFVSSIYKFTRTYFPYLVDYPPLVQIWRVENFNMVPLENMHYGEFYGGDCYVILYTYLVQGKEKYIIYYWIVSLNVCSSDICLVNSFIS